MSNSFQLKQKEQQKQKPPGLLSNNTKNNALEHIESCGNYLEINAYRHWVDVEVEAFVNWWRRQRRPFSVFVCCYFIFCM